MPRRDPQAWGEEKKRKPGRPKGSKNKPKGEAPEKVPAKPRVKTGGFTEGRPVNSGSKKRGRPKKTGDGRRGDAKLAKERALKAIYKEPAFDGPRFSDSTTPEKPAVAPAIHARQLKASEYDSEAISKARYIIINPPGLEKNLCICLNELSDDDLMRVLNLRSQGVDSKAITETIKSKWGQLPDASSGTLIRALRLFFGIYEAKEPVPLVSPDKPLTERVAYLTRRLQVLEQNKRVLEKRLADDYQPLDELIYLAKVQRERIEEQRTKEKENKQTIKELDGMIDTMREIIADYIKGGKTIGLFSGNNSEMPRMLSGVHVHMQQHVNDAPAVLVTVQSFARELESIAIPMTDDGNGEFSQTELLPEICSQIIDDEEEFYEHEENASPG